MKITFLEEPPFIIGKQRGPFISFLLPMHQNWHRHLIKSRDGGLCIAASISFQNVLNILLRVWHNVMFRNKRSQAKGVYYVFLYKQHMDNVYTRVAIHRFTIGSLVVGQSSSSPPQSWISTWLVNTGPTSPCGSRLLSQYSHLTTAFQPDSLSLPLSLLWTGRFSVSCTL